MQPVPAQLYPSPPIRSASYIDNTFAAASILHERSTESLSSGRHYINHQPTTATNERPYFHVGDQQ